MTKLWELPGGVHPAENKQQSLNDPIGSLPLPERLVIPLNQHIGAPASPVVNVGEQVLKGQLLGEPSSALSTAVHASTSGVITAIDRQPVPHPSGMSTLCISLEPDGHDTWGEHQSIANYHCVAPGALLEVIRHAGIAGLGGAGFPTAIKLQPHKPIDTLIINATECEPYITADDSLMRERPEEIVEGINILRHILGNPSRVVIGIEDNKPEAYNKLQPLLKDTAIELLDFHTQYPSGGEKQLIYILTGKEVPSGGLPADIGIVCQNIGTTHAIYRAVCEGRPLISRITTVTGKALNTNRNYEVLIGTPVSHLLAHNGFDPDSCARLIMGGPMMGFTLPNPEVPVVKTTNCILAPSYAEMPPPPPAQACIRCGMCAEACPASLLPQQLFWYAQSQNHEKLEAYSLFDCIECGACSYVCPSNIPLVQYYRAAKGEIRQAQLEHVKADRARQRFEFHKARQEKAAQEKAAKREARRLAAEQAKSKTDSGTDDLVKAAMARAQQRQNNPQQQLERQQRAVENTAERVRHAQEKLTELETTGTAEQIEQARAKLEDTRHRHSEAKRKLLELQSEKPAGDPAADAIARAQAKAGARAEMSESEKLQETINSLKSRLQKSEQRLVEAEQQGSEHLDALRSGTEKLRTKLAEAQAKLEEQQC